MIWHGMEENMTQVRVFLGAVVLALIVCCWSPAKTAAQEIGESARVAEDLDVVRMSGRVYMHVSRYEMPPFGLVPANGLILVDKGEAFLFDTPWTESQTEVLLDWIENVLHARVTACVPNHWHKDAMGGLPAVCNYVASRPTPTTALLPLPAKRACARRSTASRASGRSNCTVWRCINVYLVGGHSTDGIFVWIPAENLLFPGCMAKDAKAVNLGNTEDADVRAWPGTMEKALAAFPGARIVVPRPQGSPAARSCCGIRAIWPCGRADHDRAIPD